MIESRAWSACSLIRGVLYVCACTNVGVRRSSELQAFAAAPQALQHRCAACGHHPASARVWSASGRRLLVSHGDALESVQTFTYHHSSNGSLWV